MGLFSSKTKTVTQVGTQVSRVFEDKLVPNSVRRATYEAMQFDEDLMPKITQGIMGSLGVRVEHMYRYGDNGYIFGSPSGETHTANIDTAQVADALRTIYPGETVVVESAHFSKPNLMFLALKAMQEHFGYNESTNRLHALETMGNTATLDKLFIALPPSMVDSLGTENLDGWARPRYQNWYESVYYGNEGNPFVVDGNISHPQVRVVYKTGSNNYWYDSYQSEIQEAPLTGFDLYREYFHIKFLLNGAQQYMLYALNSNTYPALEAVVLEGQQYTVMGNFFPNLYFRFNKQSMSADKQSQAYKSSKKMGDRYLGMGYDNVVDSIHENPDIEDIEQAYMMLAVPPMSGNQMETRYLFDFFSKLYGTQKHKYFTPGQIEMRSALSQIDNTTLQHALTLQDALFRMVLSAGNITKRFRPGVIGTIGHCTVSRETKPVSYTVWDDYAGSGQGRVETYDKYGYAYRKQTSTGVYEEIRVEDLQIRYHVYGSYSTIGNENTDYLLVPLDHSITQHYSIPDREELFGRSMHYIFNTRVTQTYKVRWYQSGWFSVFIMIVAIIITIWTGGAASAAVAAVAAGAATTVSAILISHMVFALVKMVIVSVVVQLVVEIAGPEIGLIVAIVAAAYAMNAANAAGGLSNSPWASTLLKASVSLVNKSTEKFVQNKMAGLQSDIYDFQKEAEKQLELLEQANDLLETSSVLAPMLFVGESPDDFYNRTIHSGNLGMVTIAQTTSFVDRALTLPSFRDTAQEFSYA